MCFRFLISFFSTLTLIYFSNCYAVYHFRNYPTAIIHFQPMIPQNGRAKAGECWVESIAAPRTGAWRCRVENEIFDPCFSTENGAIVCGANPATYDEGFVLKLTNSLPPKTTDSARQLQESAGWLLKLADGSLCSPFTGTMPVVEQIPLKFSCSDSSGCINGFCPHQTGLSLYSVREGRYWSATKVTYSVSPEFGMKIKKMHVVPIVTVWQ